MTARPETSGRRTWPRPRSRSPAASPPAPRCGASRPTGPSTRRHVAVEFVHPVIMGKRALPAVAVDDADPVACLRAQVRRRRRPARGGPASRPRSRPCCERAPAWGLTTVWIGAGSRARRRGGRPRALGRRRRSGRAATTAASCCATTCSGSSPTCASSIPGLLAPGRRRATTTAVHHLLRRGRSPRSSRRRRRPRTGAHGHGVRDRRHDARRRGRPGRPGAASTPAPPSHASTRRRGGRAMS